MTAGSSVGNGSGGGGIPMVAASGSLGPSACCSRLLYSDLPLSVGHPSRLLIWLEFRVAHDCGGHRQLKPLAKETYLEKDIQTMSETQNFQKE